jgi:uncharacterized protein (TIGR03086 family)
MIDLLPAGDRMVEVLAGIGEDRLTDPTPCAEYTVGDLVDHVDQVCLGFASLARREPGEGAGAGSGEGAGEGAGTEGVHRRAGWRDTVTRHVRELGKAWEDASAWRGSTELSGLELSNALWGKIALTELVVHGWDLAVATGQPFDLPEHTLRACHEHVAEFVPKAPIPSLWGQPARVGPDATLLERIVAITGRNPPAHRLR